MLPRSILLCTVGGSHQPIVTGILQHRPDFVHFLCSDDAGKLKGSYTHVVGEGKIIKSSKDLDKPDLPNIVIQAGLEPQNYTVHKIQHFDDLNACYLEASRVIGEARVQAPAARIVADYTGGTKSMTAGLAAAALDDGRCDISLVAGQRGDLVAVQNQTEFVRPIHVWDAQALRRMRAAQELLHHYDYAAAEQLLCDAAARFAGENTLQALQRGIALCRAFDAWDKFRHTDARQLLRPYQGQFVPWWRVLGSLAGESQGFGFELVEDLLLNAQRRAEQERFDDAVGRIYRATELTAQIWLRIAHGIETGDVKVELVPQTKRADVERCPERDGTFKIGLRAAWEVIAAFPDDPLGKLFAEQRGRLLDFLSVRNDSLFAHGIRPVSQTDYRKHAPPNMDFLRGCIDGAVAARELKRQVVLQQLPINFLDDQNGSAPQI